MKATLRVIVCGSLYYPDKALVWEHLSRLNEQRGPFALLCSEPVTGVAELARSWAKENDVPSHNAFGNPDKFGAAADRIRRTHMIASVQPNLVIAFPGGPETTDLVTKARAAGIEVIEIGAVE